MQSSVSIIHSLTECSREELLRDIALSEFIERQSDTAPIQITYDSRETLLRVDDTEVTVESSLLALRGDNLSPDEIIAFYRLDLFEEEFFSPLLRPLIADERSSLMHEYRCAYTDLRKAGYRAHCYLHDTGETVSPAEDTFWNESRRFVEFVREAIQGISITRRGLEILARLDAKMHE